MGHKCCVRNLSKKLNLYCYTTEMGRHYLHISCITGNLRDRRGAPSPPPPSSPDCFMAEEGGSEPLMTTYVNTRPSPSSVIGGTTTKHFYGNFLSDFHEDVPSRMALSNARNTPSPFLFPQTNLNFGSEHFGKSEILHRCFGVRLGRRDYFP